MAGISLLGLASSAMAQSGSPSSTASPQATAETADNVGLQDIVVTAQRREQRLQDVPIAVTAYSAKQLSERQIVDVVAVALQTPNVSTVTAYSPADIRLTIRGISTIQPSPSIDPAVGVYVDGVYYAVNTGANLGFIDMERVEVLKGPQGTLFGRNTIGGLLNITTQKPTYDLGGSATLGYGNYNQLNATGVLNVPIVSEKLAARLVYDHAQHDGFGRDTYLNQPLGDIDRDYVRLGVRFDPSEDWNIVATGFWSKLTGHSPTQKLTYIGTDFDGYCSFYPECVSTTGGKPLSQVITNSIGGNFYDNQAIIDPPLRTTTAGVTATITGQIGGVTLKSITGYEHISESLGDSLDGSPVPFLLAYERVDVRQISQEFQVSGKAFDNRLQLIGGLYYFNDYGFEDEPSLFLSSQVGTGSAQNVSNYSYAAYAQGTVTITDNLHLTGGLRYTLDRREVNWHDQTTAGPDFFTNFVSCSLALPAGVSTTDRAACNFPAHTSFHYFPWTVSLDYKPLPDMLVYAKISRGYRSGGYSLSGPPASASTPAQIAVYAAPFQPESALQPEVGLKLDTLDRKLRLNLAAFYTRYSAIQLNTEVNAGTTLQPVLLSVTRNVGEADIFGVEGDATILFHRAQFNLSGGIVLPHYTSGPDVGLPFVNTSKYSFSINAQYPLSTDYGTYTLSATYSWRSQLYGYEPIPGNYIQNVGARQDGFGLIDARVSLELKKLPVTLAFWGKNLGQVHYKAQPVDYFGYSLDSSGYIAGDPRTFGGTVTYHF